MDSIESGYVCVAEVLSKSKIYESLKLLSTLYNVDVTFEEINGINYTKGLDNIAIGYTDDRFIAVVNSQNSDATLTDALAKNLADLTIFGESDMASYINLNKALNAIETSLNEPTNATTTTQCQQLIADFRTRLTPEANILTTATFELGRATIDQRINGADLSGYNKFFHKGENNHLNYLSNNVIAVANLGINGTTLAELFNEIISNETVRHYANFGNEMAIDELLASMNVSIGGYYEKMALSSGQSERLIAIIVIIIIAIICIFISSKSQAERQAAAGF